ncbi:MAG: DUF4288 domain-containing protein [Bacteroidia bacterium]
MKRFLAKLMFNINIDNGNHNSQFDEQIRIIEARSEEEAFFKARRLGREEEESFTNTENKTVNWKFIDVSNLYMLDNVADGAQLYSTTHEAEDANAFIKFIRQKSMVIQAKNLTFA